FAVPNNGHNKYPPEPNPFGPCGNSTNAAMETTAIDVATCAFDKTGTLYSIPSSRIIERISLTDVSKLVAAKLTTMIETIVVAMSAGIAKPENKFAAPSINTPRPTSFASVKLLYVAENCSALGNNVITAIIAINARI